MALFSKFCELPAELRHEVWKLAATAPRVIHLEVFEDQPDKFTALNGPHPLLRTCWESRQVYSWQVHSRQIHDKLEAENGQFPVDFTQDVFFFERHPHATTPPTALAWKIEKAAFRQEGLCCIRRLSSFMPRLREVDLVLRDQTYRYYPAPTSAFRPYPLHLCRIHPRKSFTFSLDRFTQIDDPCPTCEWLADMYYDQLPFDSPRGFTPMLDCSLGIYPKREDILGCEYPMIRFARTRSLWGRKKGNKSIIEAGDQGIAQGTRVAVYACYHRTGHRMRALRRRGMRGLVARKRRRI